MVMNGSKRQTQSNGNIQMTNKNSRLYIPMVAFMMTTIFLVFTASLFYVFGAYAFFIYSACIPGMVVILNWMIKNLFSIYTDL